MKRTDFDSVPPEQTPEGSNIISHGFQPVVNESISNRFGEIFALRSKNYDKTIDTNDQTFPKEAN